MERNRREQRVANRKVSRETGRSVKFNITWPDVGQFFLPKCRRALGDHAGDYAKTTRNYTKLHD